METSAVRHYTDHFHVVSGGYNAALQNHGFDQLIVHSGKIKNRFQDDMRYPFFVSVPFKALVPLIDAPDSWIIWELGERPLLLLYQPDDYWHIVPEIADTYWTPFFDIVPIKEKAHAQQYFGNTRKSAFLGEINGSLEGWDLGERNPELLIAELNWLRSYKTTYEQACIQEANRISVKGHVAARDAFYNDAGELDISLAFQKACQQSEEALAYPSIVGINRHAAILHYWGRDTVAPKQLHSLLIDAAASYQGYAADITRTYAYKDGLFADMIIALDQAQQALVSAHTVGARYVDLTFLMRKKVAVVLRDFNVVKMDVDLMVESDIVRKFIPHSLGHFLGLQVHDVGSNQADKSGACLEPDPRDPMLAMLRAIEPDQVITVEPGIYFIEQLLKELYDSEHRKVINWDTVEQLKSCGGIRIEDNVLITTEGPVNLTRQAFQEGYS